MSHVGILTAWNYALSVLSACFVLGIAIFLIDRKFGVHLYRFGYDFFHKDPMPEDIEHGFLYGQSSNRGVAVSVFLSTLYSLYMLWHLGFSMNFIAELIVWLLMPPALVGGFWAGRGVYRLLLRRSAYFDTLDQFSEQIENVHVADVAQKVTGKGASALSSILSFLPSRRSRRESVPVIQKPVPQARTAQVSEEGESGSFREQIRRYRRN